MRQILRFLEMRWVTAATAVLICILWATDARVLHKARLRWEDGERFSVADDQTDALTNALKEHHRDYPQTILANDRAGTEQLFGSNPRRIKYLKSEKFSRDVSGSLIDPTGAPYVLKFDGDQYTLECIGYPMTATVVNDPDDM